MVMCGVGYAVGRKTAGDDSKFTRYFVKKQLPGFCNASVSCHRLLRVIRMRWPLDGDEVGGQIARGKNSPQECALRQLLLPREFSEWVNSIEIEARAGLCRRGCRGLCQRYRGLNGHDACFFGENNPVNQSAGRFYH